MNSTDSTFPADTFGPDGQVVKSPYYDYLVSMGTAYAFVILFSISTLVHLFQASYYRMWWLLITVVLAGVGEIAGWSGRLWSAYSPLLQDPFLMQIVATILAPTPFVAALFILFGRITRKLGVQYSRLSPQWYSRIFLTADIIALVVQGVGGGLAASADSDAGSDSGAKIMLGGIIFQLIALIAFIGVSSEFYIRYICDLPVHQPETYAMRTQWGRKMKIFTASLVFIVICIFIRSIYRTAELADGWNGRIIETEVYFNVLDGMMVLLAMWTMNFFHPGYWMKTPEDDSLERTEVAQMVALTSYPKDFSTISTPNPSSTHV